MTAASKNPTMQGGGGTREAQLGLVGASTLAGEGCPTSEPCHFCGETGGHTAQCPVVSKAVGS